ncbi:MAG TPA: DUF3575 domain-containing protein [Prolixibacteraceae bacterium]|nr:DUF3575 domain-containing protein [Prolixibacteraceae bacterium]HPS12588.1 DUF3575 domain-containing protein [Prolixibacteraceae bacterium]
MKIVAFLIGFVLILFISEGVNASERGNEGIHRPLGVRSGLPDDMNRNILKMNPGKLLLGGINLSYERIITQKTTLNIRAKYHLMGFVERRIRDFSTSGENYSFGLTDKPHFYSLGIDAEYRYYLGKRKVAQGFYVAPYLRYQKVNGEFQSEYSTTVVDPSIRISGALNTSFKIWGGGGIMGYQWILNDWISIDWSFVGLGIDHYNFRVGVQSDNLYDVVDTYTQDLQKAMGSVSNFLAKRLAFNALDNELRSDVPFWMVGWKSSLTVGIAF